MYWLFKQVPLAVVLIIAVLILLFGDYRKPTIVLCCIPLWPSASSEQCC